MKKKIIFISLVIVLLTGLVGCSSSQTSSSDATVLRLATTTSTKDSGLLDYLLPTFEKENNIKVEVLSQGTGQAIKTASMGDADVILVHAKAAEEKFVADGYGVKRYDVMYNDFVIVGPANDPVGIKGKGAIEAFSLMANAANEGAPFISRGDDSGTNKKEIGLWKEANIEPNGGWYLSVGKGMGDTLIMTNEKEGYTLTDRGTYLFMKNKLDIQVLVEGDKLLMNPYGVIAVNPEKHERINNKDAKKFIDFLLSDEGQKMIKEYKVNDNQLFYTYE